MIGLKRSKNRNNALVGLGLSALIALTGAATTYYGVITSPTGVTAPLILIGIGVGLAGGISVYQTGMQWGEATQAIADANINSETAWNQIENQP